MVFCSNCGDQIANEAKFCPECGTPIATDSVKTVQRQQEFSGKIIKCPNCGEVLDAFVVACPSCGYELREIQTSESVQKFTQKLENADTEEQRIDLIRSFPVPNAKEDIFEFIILASTNISGESRKGIFDAWVAKFEQSYHKAKLVFSEKDDFTKIQAIYDKTSKQIIRAKGIQGVKSVGGIVAKLMTVMPNPIFGIAVILIVIFAVIRIFSGNFAGIDIIFAVLILWGVYKITNTKKPKKEGVPTGEDKQESVMLKFPLDSGGNAYVLQAKLEQTGFTNIRMINLKDIKFGLLKKSGEIESVSVNGKASRPFRKIAPNTPIIITYHGRPDES